MQQWWVHRGILAALAAVLLGAAWGRAETQERILFLHSYHKAAWSDSLLEGYASVLGERPGLELLVEYMDTKRNSSPAYYELLRQVYQAKYDDVTFDVVLVSDDNAFRFALELQDTLFHGAPIVFCGVNDYEPEMLAAHPDVTGVVEHGDFAGTLSLAASLRPSAQCVHVVCDRTTTGNTNLADFLKAFAETTPGLQTVLYRDTPLPLLRDMLARIPPEDYVFFISYWADGLGRPVTPEDLGEAFRGCPAPVFGRSEWMMGLGMLGGKCVSGYQQGATAARLARQILNGATAASLPVVLESPNVFMFDHEVLRRHRIAASALPPGSEVIHLPAPFYFVGKRTMVMTVGALLLFALLTGILTMNIMWRRRAERALLASERNYRHIFNGTNEGICLLDGDGDHVLDANDALLTMHGYARSEVTGLSIADFSALDTATLARQVEQIRLALTADGSVTHEWPCKRKDGTRFPVEATVKRVTIGGLPRIMVVTRDISERKRSEEALRDSEERYRQIFRAESDAIIVFDAKTLRVIEVNGAAEHLFGYDSATFTTLRLLDLSAEPEQSARVLSKMQAGDIIRVPLRRFRRSDGSIFSAEVSGSTFMLNGRLVNCGTVRDVTARLKAEEERRDLERQLNQSRRLEAIGQLAGGVAHDFNNLLQAIQGYTDMALQDQDKPGAVREHLGLVMEASQKAAGLVRQLLTFSRQKPGKPAAVNLRTLVSGVNRMLNRVLGEHIEVSVSHAVGLWPVSADAGQIEQVLINLCLNARDAMPKGGRILITTENAHLDASHCEGRPWVKEGRYVALSVVDTGSGIPDALRERIFEPFFTTKEVGQGTGLGLATVYGIVKQHAGLVQVESQLGKGSTFRVYLPAVREDEAPATGPGRREGSVRGGAETILVAEDNAVVRELAVRVLREAGYAVLPCLDGEHAIRTFDQHMADIDLLVLDVMMPGRGGNDVHDHVLSRSPRMPVIFSTGYSDDALVGRLDQENGAAIIHKPYRPSALLRRVREVLDRQNARAAVVAPDTEIAKEEA